MNKMLLVLLAVCLVSTHAFVKRDAETKEASPLDKFTEDLKAFGDKIKDQFDVQKIQKNVNEFVEGMQKKLEELKPDTTEKKP